jgi:two-component system, chemotaxis family, protein-glutamate methylesterase/glutaminase
MSYHNTPHRNTPHHNTPHHNIIVIGASAGGVETLSHLVKNLPSDLAAAIFIVVHFPTYATSVLPAILNRAGSLSASHPVDRQKIHLNHIYVAPPNYHMVIEQDCIRLIHGPRENGHRPAIDPLFRSAAKAYQQQVIGVVLSGALDDGTTGLAMVKQRGGIAIVQDPQDALFDGMPKSAIAHVPVDYVLPIPELADTLVNLVQDEIETGALVMEDDLEQDAEIVKQDKLSLERGERQGEPSMLTCPDCGGVLWELGNGNLIRYRCHVGHTYTVDSLAAEQSEAVETALWTAYRALEEQAALSRRLASQAQEQNRALSAERFGLQAMEITQKAAILHQILTQGDVKVTFNISNSARDSAMGM